MGMGGAIRASEQAVPMLFVGVRGDRFDGV
jgi:hypothetical protein